MSGPWEKRSRNWLANTIARSPLRLHFVVTLLALIPILIFSIFTDRLMEQNAERASQAENAQIARLSATLVGEHFLQHATLLESLTRDPEFMAAWQKKDLKEIAAHLSEIHALQPDSALASTYLPDGTMNAIAPLDPSVIGENFSYRDWYKGVTRYWQPYVSEVYRPRASPQGLAVAIAVPIKDRDGKPIGIIAAAYSVERITSWLTLQSERGVRRIQIVDQNGRLVAGPGIDPYQPPVELGSYPPVRKLMTSESGSGLFFRDGQDYIASYVPIPTLHWGVVVEQPQAEVRNMITDSRERTAWLIVILVLFAIVSGGVIANSYRQQQRLANRLESLAMSESRYRSLIDGAALGIYRSNSRGFVTANPALVKMMGYDSLEELLRLVPERDLYVDPAARRKLIEDFREHGLVGSAEVQWKKKNGSVITVRLSGRSIPGDNDDEFEMIAEDVTERHRLEERLRQSQKMEAIGRLAGGVAHDFNNLLTVIGGFNEMVGETLDASHPGKAQVEEIRRATDRASAMTRQLLAFSRQQVFQLKVININSVIQGMDGILRRLVGAHITFETKLDPNAGNVQADPGQLGQVLMNLVLNARDAMPDGGRISIETFGFECAEPVMKQATLIPAGSYVGFSVTDNGTGMDADVQSKLFEPFFTTKPAGSGTGLGLATSYGIVKQSHGFIWVYSEVGMGSTFKVYLPRSGRPDQPTGSLASALQGSRSKERIMLVEDDQAVRQIATTFLRRAGYEVIEYSDVESASKELHRLKSDGRALDLVLTDVVLRRGSGKEVANLAGELFPTTPVLFMSGYAGDVQFREGSLSESERFLQKPFTADSLVRKVREVLDATSSPSKSS